MIELNEARVLVLLSSYNGEKYIAAQIDSIMMQENVSVHLRIRDDGSSDHTCNVIQEKQKEYPGKIELIRENNIGTNASFFKLLKGAHGYDFYALSDQDDIWLPDKLKSAVRAMHGYDPSLPLLYASTSYIVGDDLKPQGQTRKQEKPFTIYNTIIQNICPGHSQVLNNALLQLIQDENIDTSRIFYYDYWIANVAQLYGRIIFSNKSHSYYRQHKGNQLGSGRSRIGKLFSSAVKVMKGDAPAAKEQMEYFAEMNGDKLAEEGYLDELEKFFQAKTFAQKLRYIRKSRLYRQSNVETAAFKLAVLTGKYDTEKDKEK